MILSRFVNSLRAIWLTEKDKTLKNPPDSEGFEWLFDEFYNLSEDIWIANREVREDFSIESDTLDIHRVDKCRIIHPKWTDSIIETDIPESAEVSLLCLSSDIGILSSLHDGIAYSRVDISVHTAISFCESDPVFMSFVCHYTTFYASHSLIVKSEKLKVKRWRSSHCMDESIFHREVLGDTRVHSIHERHVRIYLDLLPWMIYPWGGVVLPFYWRCIFQFQWFLHVSWHRSEFWVSWEGKLRELFFGVECDIECVSLFCDSARGIFFIDGIEWGDEFIDLIDREVFILILTSS